jgi:hypothetical protein
MLNSGFIRLVIWESDRNLQGCRCVIATREKTTILCSRTFVLFTLRTLLKDDNLLLVT